MTTKQTETTFDYEPFKQYVTEAVRDGDTLKIHTVKMPNAQYVKLRNHLKDLGFQRHPRQRYFYAPVSPEAEAIALNLVDEIGDVEPEAVAEKPAPQAKTKPAPKPTRRKRAPRKKKPDEEAWAEDIPMG